MTVDGGHVYVGDRKLVGVIIVTAYGYQRKMKKVGLFYLINKKKGTSCVLDSDDFSTLHYT